jgi:pyruvate/2-oxoglutarate dehydrogenase complex dihydrolipoamide acyltransferase (E2) component
MSIEILMPALSPTMEEGTLAKWHVKAGDTVKAGDVIAEIETDKATMEVEAVDEGVIEALLVDAGTEGVKVNAVIARLAGEGEAPAPTPAPKAAEPAKAAAPQAAPATKLAQVDTVEGKPIMGVVATWPKATIDAVTTAYKLTSPKHAEGMLNLSGMPFNAPVAELIAWCDEYREFRLQVNEAGKQIYTPTQAAELVAEAREMKAERDDEAARQAANE